MEYRVLIVESKVRGGTVKTLSYGIAKLRKGSSFCEIEPAKTEIKACRWHFLRRKVGTQQT